jgi:hypothetical protein
MNEHICIDKKIFLFLIFIVTSIIYIFFDSYTIDKENTINMHNLLFKSINKLTHQKIKPSVIDSNINYPKLKLNPYIQNHVTLENQPKIQLHDKPIRDPKIFKGHTPTIIKIRKPQYHKHIKKPVLSSYEDIPASKPQLINNNFALLNNDIVRDRDTAVIKDVLYPPYARTERPVFDNLINSLNTNISTRGSEDTFRQIGFLINKDRSKPDMGNNNWRLFGRQSYRGSTIGEYYVLPVDVNYANLKIFLKDDMMPNEKLRDMYALPKELTLKSPMFNNTPYEVVELPKPDLNSSYI